MIWWSALILGLAGSLHCLGMCGPLALAVPFKGSKVAMLWGRLTYNMGRIISYMFLGLLIGSLGSGFSFFGMQRVVSIATGIVLLVVLFYQSTSWSFKPTGLLNRWVQKGFGKVWKTDSRWSPLLLGVLNGFLPCGLVYIALTGALVLGDLSQSTLYMLLFGLGTVPALFFAGLLNQHFSGQLSRRFRKVKPILIFLFACIFIVRGLNLGIPYLSPKVNSASGEIECCEPQN